MQCEMGLVVGMYDCGMAEVALEISDSYLQIYQAPAVAVEG